MPTQRGLDRIVTFADAVVAIACTLLVLPLVDLATTGDEIPVDLLLRDHIGQFGAFALSFVVIARLWVAHHRIAERLVSYDTMVIRLTLAWLFTVAFLPFPTAILATQSGQGASTLYVATLLASSLSLAATAAWVGSHPDLASGAGRASSGGQHFWTTPALLGVALALTALVPSAGVWPLLLLLLTGPIDAVLRRRTPLPTASTNPSTVPGDAG